METANDYMNILMKCPLFKNINEVELLHLLSCLDYSIKSYKADEYLYLSGDVVNYVVIILSGTIDTVKETLSGNRHIIDHLEASDLLGEGVVCTQNRISPVSAQVRDNTKLLFIPYEKITVSCGHACGFHNHLVKNMMLLLGEKNYSLSKKMDLLSLKGMREKIASYLLNESQLHKTNTFNISLNRTELAEYLNVSRPSMSRELSKMKDEGIIDYYKNSFRIVSKEALVDCLD